MYILGVGCFYHDSSACLLKDGIIVCAAEEERFTRIKHDNTFPINSIKFCLEDVGISINDIDYVAFYEKPIMKFERVISQCIEMFPSSYPIFIKSIPSWLTDKLRIPTIFRKKLKYTGDILFVEHHISHAASSFFASPFKDAAIVTVDGVGEWATTTIGIGHDNKIQLFSELNFPHSIGLLYSTFTAHLGFSVNNSEYKVMGLSPYGNMNRKTNIYYKKMLKLVDFKKDGSFKFDMSYFVYHYKMTMPGKKLIEEFGPIRKGESEVTQNHKDIAAALQLVTEDLLFNLLNAIQKKTNLKNLCIAGGVGLNSVANGRILKNTKFKDVYIQPASSDSGTAIGAALFVYNQLLKKPRKFIMNSASLGPIYTDKQIKVYLDKNKIKYTKFDSDIELVKETARLIHENNVIGWMQGRMEWGPRALGNRSILSNATNPNMQDILNLKVKHREKFRPFAPVVCVDDALLYFNCDKPIPSPTDFMLMVYPVIEDKRKIIPSVTHVDGSGRLQTIRREQNPLYFDLIKEFGALSGVPILINTSFNIRGEPIVCKPHDAYRCMMGTGIDYLVMGNFLIARADNPKDMWDSESIALD